MDTMSEPTPDGPNVTYVLDPTAHLGGTINLGDNACASEDEAHAAGEEWLAERGHWYGGRGGQRPGEDGQDGASIGGGIGGKGGKGGAAHVVPAGQVCPSCEWHTSDSDFPEMRCPLCADSMRPVYEPAEPDVGMALAAVAAELRRTGQIDGNTEFEVETDGVHYRVVEVSE